VPETFHLFARAVDVRPLEDCLIGIVNDEVSDPRRRFELVRLAVMDPAPMEFNTSGTGRAGKLQLFRTTAQSGGEVITPNKHDTNSPDLPAQVLAAVNPDSVTTTGAALRTIADAPSYSFTAITHLSARNFGGSLTVNTRQHMADIWRTVDPTLEPLVLREGEGMALTQLEAGVPHSMAIACIVTNYSTGATYMVRSRSLSTDPIIGNPVWGLFNGAGSGVVLAVQVVILPMDGESNLPMTMRLALIDGVDRNADAIVPFAADTVNAVPSALAAYRGPFRAKLIGEGMGWQADWHTLHGTQGLSILQQQNAGVIRRKTYGQDFGAVGRTLPNLRHGSLSDFEIFKAKAGSGIVLRPGMGVGLLAGRGGVLDFSTFHCYHIEATILHYPPDSGGAVFPAEGDVRDGVTYGPTGADNEGDLVLPVEADVKLGTSYGDNGTEFTGTLAGGSGGGGMIYRRR